MALPHLPPGDIAPLALPAQALTQTASHALFKTAGMQVMRIVLPKGHALPEHSAPGPITMQCLQGALQVQAGWPMSADWMALAGPAQREIAQARELRDRKTSCRERV